MFFTRMGEKVDSNSEITLRPESWRIYQWYAWILLCVV